MPYDQSFGAFLQAAGNTVPVYFLTTYSISILSYSSSTGSLLLAVNTAVNSVARIGMGILADRVGRQNTMILSVRPSFCRCGLHPTFSLSTTGHPVRSLGLRVLVRLGPRPLHHLHHLLRHPRWRVQRPPPDHDHGSVRGPELLQRERLHLLHPRSGCVVRCPYCWCYLGESPAWRFGVALEK